MKKERIAVTAIAGIAAGTIGYAVYLTKKATDIINKFEEEVDSTSETLSKSVYDKVSEEIVNKAIKKAADKKVSEEVGRGAQSVVSFAKTRLSSEINNAVNAEWSGMKTQIKGDLLKKVGDIDPGDVKREAVLKAKEEYLDKVHDEVDKALADLRTKYEDKIDDYMDEAEDRFDDKLDEMIEDLEKKYSDRLLRAIRKGIKED